MILALTSRMLKGLVSEHQDGHVAGFADALAHLNAVQLGQHHVQQHQVHRLGVEHLQGFFAVGSGQNLIAFLFEGKTQAFDNEGLVVHQ